MKPLSQLLTTLGLSLLAALTAGVSFPPEARADGSHHEVREIEIVVQGSYTPSRIEVVEGQHVQLKFIRKESSACTREVVFPAIGIRKELPEGKPVLIHLPELKAGEYEFKCGMDMIKGKLIVRPRG
jgi:plastocyanin domain-containing protein